MNYIILIAMLILAVLVGCSPVITIEPVTSIQIVPEHAEIILGQSIGLYCIDQLNRQVSVVWSKRCPAGTLSDDLGVSITYTPNTTGIQEIYATYEDLKATARIKGIKERR